MVSEHHLSERRACRLVGLSRDSYRHPPETNPMTQDLTGKIVEIAHVRAGDSATGAFTTCCARSSPA
jgi:putative transposase